MKKFILEAIDPSGQTHSDIFFAKSFEDGVKKLGDMGARNIKSDDPYFCTDPIRSWSFTLGGLLWNAMAGPAPKK